MDTANMNKSVTNINALGFTNIWSGTAYEVQSEQLSSLMTKLNQCIADISAFDAILLLRDLYIAICEQIKSLYSDMAACASGHGEEQEKYGCGTCASISSQISQKENERIELRNQIIGLLGQFSGIEAEVAAPGNLAEEVVPTELEGIGEFPEEQTQQGIPTGVTNPNYDGRVLSPSQGRNDNGPQGCETWYDLNMDFVVERMDTVYGKPIEAWIDPETGIKMCRPVGEEDKAYVMVAADAESVWGNGNDVNPDSTYHMGDIVQTSWGEGMVVDYCELAVNKRKAGQENHFDIATAWGSGYYAVGEAAAKKENEGK